jgi:integrase
MTKKSGHKGIDIRIGADGKKTYRARSRKNGYPDQSASFTRLTDAVRWKQQTDTDIDRDKYFPASEARKHTFEELVDRYIKTVLPRKPIMEKKQTTQLLWWKEQIGNRWLAEVSPPLIFELRDKLLNETTYRHTKRSSATVNRYLAVLSHAFSVAVNEWHWLSESPMKKLKLKEPPGRDRRLSDDERDRLLRAAKASENPHIYLVILIALSTGARLNECLWLRYEDITWKDGTCRLTFKKTKNQRPHTTPLLGPAKELLEEKIKNRRSDSQLIFPAGKGLKERPAVIRGAWDKLLVEANIDSNNFSFHCLRHSVGSQGDFMKIS